MRGKDRRDGEECPATVGQLAAAMAALGAYHGHNTDTEHAAEAKRLGGVDAYRLRMANALLGIVQTEAVLAENDVTLDVDERRVAWAQQVDSAGVQDDPAKLIGFIQWQVLRAATPLREIAQHTETGPIPVAAAHAAEGLQRLLGVIAASQTAIATGDVAALATQAPALREARASLESAITNTDLLLELLASVGL